jgi:UDP-glucose:(heptosyl)LPS alpha-1,3-glucosyltransferase
MSSPSRQSGPGHELTIGFVRRGYSSAGGAEAYLKRLGAGVVAAGYRASLITAAQWPGEAWDFGPIARLKASSAIQFADELEKLPREAGDILFSLERVWRCDVYRAGDGVHRAWLERRGELAGPLKHLRRLLNQKHSAALRLEESLFAKRGARRVIANSRMVKDEIVRWYGYPAEQIEVVYNGVPRQLFEVDEQERLKSRKALGLGAEDTVVLFVGSGWERKGLRFAIEAVQRNANLKLVVAGRGDARKLATPRVQFLGVVSDLPTLYGAADIFLLPTIYDPFSNACLEALAAGLPVITTKANGFSEIMESGRHGTVIDEPQNATAISDALQFWSDPDRRRAARSENLALAQRFDISTNVEATLRIATQIAASAAST